MKFYKKKMKKGLDKSQVLGYTTNINKRKERNVIFMNSTLFIQFVLLNVANVIIQTVKSLATVKCGKMIASIVNAIAYGLYTVVVVYTVCELPLWLKVVVVGLANLIGVFFVKLGEEKMKKDKLWKVEMTIKPRYKNEVEKILKHNECRDFIFLNQLNISYNYIDLEKWIVFNIYCENQKESSLVREICDRFKAKFFVTETKSLF